MSWNFSFQGSRIDALNALNNVTVTTGPGHQDQWNRIKPIIQSEIMALNDNGVVVSASGSFHGSLPNYRSIFRVNAQNLPVLNNAVLVPPNTAAP